MFKKYPKIYTSLIVVTVGACPCLQIYQYMQPTLPTYAEGLHEGYIKARNEAKNEGYEIAKNEFLMKPTHANGLIEGYEKAKNEFLMKPTHANGLIEGYDKAKSEFHQKCVRSIKTSMDYADKNLKILDENGILDDTYVKDSLLLRILPKWKLEIFNEVYIVRTPLKCDYTYAWIVPEKESDEFDNKLQNILFSCGLDMTNIDIENIQRAKRKCLYEEKG
jgi:hypothetical protein